jgi:hypothetical protein
MNINLYWYLHHHHQELECMNWLWKLSPFNPHHQSAVMCETQRHHQRYNNQIVIKALGMEDMSPFDSSQQWTVCSFTHCDIKSEEIYKKFYYFSANSDSWHLLGHECFASLTRWVLHHVAGEEVGPPVLGPSALEDMLAEKLERHRDREEQNKLSVKVLVMQPILRFLQLLCENHNRYLQVCIIMF